MLIACKAQFKSRQKKLQRFDCEYRVVTPSGILKWVQSISQPVLQDNGDIIWDGIITDISDRKDAEQELVLFKRAVESTSDAIALADPEGNLIYQNPAPRKTLRL